MQIPMSKERPLGSLLVAWPRKDPKPAARASDLTMSFLKHRHPEAKLKPKRQHQEKQLTGQNYVVKIISRNLTEFW